MNLFDDLEGVRLAIRESELLIRRCRTQCQEIEEVMEKSRKVFAESLALLEKPAEAVPLWLAQPRVSRKVSLPLETEH